MAVAADPTLASLAEEALKMAGITTTSAGYAEKLTRAKTVWMQAVLNDIWMTAEANGNTRLKTLHKTAVLLSIDNQALYSMPTDFDEELTVTVLEGANTGAVVAGAAATVTLAADEDITQADAEGRYIIVGTSVATPQYRQIRGYVVATQVATVDAAWDTGEVPAAADTYVVVDSHYKLDEVDIVELEEETARYAPGRPTRFAKYKDQLLFDRPFDAATYGILLRYYVNIHFLDLTEGATTIFTKILRNWQNVLEKGLQARAEQSIKASEYKETLALYQAAKGDLIRREIPYGGQDARFYPG